MKHCETCTCSGHETSSPLGRTACDCKRDGNGWMIGCGDKAVSGEPEKYCQLTHQPCEHCPEPAGHRYRQQRGMPSVEPSARCTCFEDEHGPDCNEAHEIFGMIDNLNAMPKVPNAPTPFGPIEYIFAHGGCWATCPVTGFGYFYKTLRAAVRAWNVDVTVYVDGKWRSVPRRATQVQHGAPHE